MFDPPVSTTDAPDDPDGRVAHHLIFLVAERLRRRYRNAVTRMHSHGIDVFDGADDDDVVVEVAHHFELVLFPTDHGGLDQDLRYRTQIQTVPYYALELLGIVGNAPTRSPESKRGPRDHGKPQRFLFFCGFFE